MEYEDELERIRAQRGKKKNRVNGARESRKENRKKRRRRRWILLVEAILLIVVLAGAYLVFGGRTHVEGYWTIAIFGVDSRNGNLGKGALSDVEMICNINKETGEIQLVSVYRDTYLKIDKKGSYDKINEAYFKGGYEQAVDALNENLDLHIDDYATFNWKAVADTINILGGIDLEITDKEFKYINSFITETVESTGIGSHHLASAGMNHLDGVQAVSYARLRLMDTDFNRTERQRKVVSLAMDKAKQADFSVLNNILVTVLPQVKTSVGAADLIPMAQGISKYHLGENAGFPFSRTTTKIGKKDCVIPTTLESNVIQLHQFLYGDLEYKAPASVRKISDQIGRDSGINEPGKNAPVNNSNSSQGGVKDSPVPTTVEETIVQESRVEETISESAEIETEENSEVESESTKQPTQEDGSLVGPGAEIETEKSSQAETTATVVETTQAETTKEETVPKENTDNGPGTEIEGPGSGPEVGPGVADGPGV